MVGTEGTPKYNPWLTTGQVEPHQCMVGDQGIEPCFLPCKGNVLPLN